MGRPFTDVIFSPNRSRWRRWCVVVCCRWLRTLMNLANLWRACCPAWEGVQFVELQVDLSLSHFVYPEFSLAWPAWVLFFIVILLVWHETSQVWITEPKFMKNPMMSNVWGLALAIFTLFWMLHVLKDCVRCNTCAATTRPPRIAKVWKLSGSNSVAINPCTVGRVQTLQQLRLFHVCGLF